MAIAAGVVVCGVFARLAGGAVATGMQDELRAEITGTNAHVTIMSASRGFARVDDVERIAEASAPGGSERFAFASGTAWHGQASVHLAVKGVAPDRVARLTDVARRMVTGAPDLRGGGAPILLGQGVARALGVGPGDTIEVTAESLGPGSGDTYTTRFRVVGTFHYPLLASEYDDHFAIAATADVVRLGPGGAFTGVDLVLADRDRAEAVADALRRQLDRTAYHVETWRTMNRKLWDVATRLTPLYAIAIGVDLDALSPGACR